MFFTRGRSAGLVCAAMGILSAKGSRLAPFDSGCPVLHPGLISSRRRQSTIALAIGAGALLTIDGWLRVFRLALFARRLPFFRRVGTPLVALGFSRAKSRIAGFGLTGAVLPEGRRENPGEGPRLCPALPVAIEMSASGVMMPAATRCTVRTMRTVLFVVPDPVVLGLVMMSVMAKPKSGHVGRVVPVEEEQRGQAGAHESVAVPEMKTDVAPDGERVPIGDVVPIRVSEPVGIGMD